MGLLVDYRTGSKDLALPLKALGCKCVVNEKGEAVDDLEFADCAFVGNGPGGRPWQVGIEVKTIDDVVQCIHSGRFAGHQLIGLMRDYDEAWLCIEGMWRTSPYGLLETAKVIPCKEPNKQLLIWSPIGVGRTRWMTSTVLEWLMTMTRAQTEAGMPLLLWRGWDRLETIRFVAAHYHWWTDDAYEKHKSLRTFVDYKRRVVARHDEVRDTIMRPPTFLRRMIKEVVGLGWERSAEIEQRFIAQKTAQDLGGVRAFGRALDQADVADWIMPHVVGKVGAAKIVRAIKTGRSE